MPSRSWMVDAISNIEEQAWPLQAGGREWTYDELLAFDDRVTAALDCPGGFYSTQEWGGARLDRLLGGAAGTSIRVTSSTGYARRFPFENARSMFLATRVGGRPPHIVPGFPARL